MEIVSFTIRDISDNEGYLQSLGKKRTAEVKRDAKVGEAEAERDAGVREAEANREKMSRVFEAETNIADAERKFNLQKAAFDKEVNTEQAKAKMAYELQVVRRWPSLTLASRLLLPPQSSNSPLTILGL